MHIEKLAGVTARDVDRLGAIDAALRVGTAARPPSRSAWEVVGACAIEQHAARCAFISVAQAENIWRNRMGYRLSW